MQDRPTGEGSMGDRWDNAETYESFMGRWSRRLAYRFLAWARLPPEPKVLEVGCGTGALSEALMGEGAMSAVCIDRSRAYVSHAGRNLGLMASRIRFAVADGTRLPFEDGRFDAAVSCLVLNFIPEPGTAVREATRVVGPDGVIAACVWDYAGRMEFLRHFWDAAVALDPTRAIPLDEGVRFPICNPNRLAGLFHEAGLRSVETAPLDEPTVFRDFEDYWRPLLGGQAPAPGYVASLNPEDREDLRERLRSTLPVAGDGSIPLIARAWAVRGVRP